MFIHICERFVNMKLGRPDVSTQSLEALLGQVGNTAEFLRNQQSGPNVYPSGSEILKSWDMDRP